MFVRACSLWGSFLRAQSYMAMQLAEFVLSFVEGFKQFSRNRRVWHFREAVPNAIENIYEWNLNRNFYEVSKSE